MATAFDVAGPMAVEVDGTGGGFAELGRVSANDRVSIDIRLNRDVYSSDEYGAVPELAVELGKTALITMTLIKYDVAVEAAHLWLTMAAAATEGEGSTVGSTFDLTDVTSGGAFKLRLRPTIAGLRQYTFGQCTLIDDNAIRRSEIGLETTYVGLAIVAAQDASGDLYTIATSS